VVVVEALATQMLLIYLADLAEVVEEHQPYKLTAVPE
jgi:hypothetical protein